MKLRFPITGLRTRLLTGATLCVSAWPAVAGDPAPSREYPKTYTERITPWYDPAGMIRKVGNVFSADTPVNMPAVGAPVDGIMRPAGDGGPAWKWYGYGTVTPNQNPHAPQGLYQPVPHDWHTQAGTTPGAVPGAMPGALAGAAPAVGFTRPVEPLLNLPAMTAKPAKSRPETPAELTKPVTEDADLLIGPLTLPKDAAGQAKAPEKEESSAPAVLTPPALAPETPAANEPPSATIKSPATIRVPGPIPDESPAPPLAPGVGASLRKPVRADAPESPAQVLPAPTPVPAPAPAIEQPKPKPATPAIDRPDGAALPTTNTDGPDIPVESAPGIVSPGGPGSVSKHMRPAYTARAQQPSSVEEAIRRAGGDIVRDVKPTGPNAVTVVLRTGNIDAAWQARDRLAKLPELKRVTVTFEVVGR